MKTYDVAIVNDAAQAQQCLPLDIDTANWEGQYRPRTQARLAYVRDQGFWLQLHCEEADPRRTYTQPDQPVYQDSCLEAFINFNPRDEQTGYINFEINANGAMWCAVGTNRHQRRFLREMGMDVPTPAVVVTPQGWTAALQIPLALIHGVYGDIPFEAGSRLRANFYKCGDHTEQPHYLSWALISLPRPDFHAPQFFGELTLRG